MLRRTKEIRSFNLPRGRKGTRFQPQWVGRGQSSPRGDAEKVVWFPPPHTATMRPAFLPFLDSPPKPLFIFSPHVQGAMPAHLGSLRWHGWATLPGHEAGWSNCRVLPLMRPGHLRLPCPTPHVSLMS